MAVVDAFDHFAVEGGHVGGEAEGEERWFDGFDGVGEELGIEAEGGGDVLGGIVGGAGDFDDFRAGMGAGEFDGGEVADVGGGDHGNGAAGGEEVVEGAGVVGRNPVVEEVGGAEEGDAGGGVG